MIRPACDASFVRWRFLFLVVASISTPACALILGIDDGIPRNVDSGVDAALDAPPDATKDVTIDGFLRLACGQTSCDLGSGQACCRTGPTTFDCIDAGATCSGTLIQCDRPEACPAGDAGPNVCCADLVSTEAGVVATSVSCKSEALCIPSQHAWLCDDAGECFPDASGCVQSTFTIPPYSICK